MHRLQLTAELIPDPQNGGYTVYCPEFDVMTQGDDPDDAIVNLREAVRGYIKTILPVPVHSGKIIKLGLLNHILRKARLSINDL